MNINTYQVIWNINLGAWVVASELAKRGKKRGSVRRDILAAPLLALYASISFALPTGNELIAGQASVTTPTAGHLQIHQTSQNAIINWQGFSIGAHESVTIQQPSASAVQLDRVVGQDPSVIQGQLNANGQVYLINPNGVIFSKTAQVDVGGLVASTHAISNADFLNGKLHFTEGNDHGSVINQGQITTPKGGIVALIGEQVTNTGSISTPQGTTVLAAGKTVDLDMQGDGLVEVKVTEAALNAQITNSGIIQAEGGQVIMTAQSASQLLKTVINNDGIVEARGLVEKNGAIVLSGGDNGEVQVGGTLDASGQGAGSNLQGGKITVSGAQLQVNSDAVVNASGDAGGGIIAIGDKLSTQQVTVQAGASLSAQALDHGKAGAIIVLANMDKGVVAVAGKLDASAPKSGDGGFIETSAAQVKVAESAKITSKAANGKSGSWLIDPYDFIVASSGGDITGTALTAALSGGDVTIQTAAASVSCTGIAGCGAGNSSGNGDIFVNDAVSWSAHTFTLNAYRNININASLNGSGTAKLALQYGQATAGGGANDNYFINNGAQVTLSAGLNFSSQKGSSGSVTPWTVITSLGLEDSTTATDLQGINGNLNGNYVLGANIDASNTIGWNNGAGFYPLGRFNSSTAFKGNFNGLNHTISNLYINRPTEDYVGLFGWTQDSGVISNTISNIGLIGGSVTGLSAVGMLIGEIAGSSISNSYATGNVTGTGTDKTGGLVGWSHNGGSINNAYATGNVTGLNQVGGLVGSNGDRGNSSISNSYATGNVTGTDNVGGLVGQNGEGPGSHIGNGSISNTYATGNVTGSTNFGRLVGNNPYGSINNSFWNSDSTEPSNAVGAGVSTGATAKTSVEMMQLGSFTGWNIANTGNSGAIWRIYEGHTAPLLTSFITRLTLTDAPDVSLTYNGLAQSGATTTNEGVLGAAATGTNAGFYNVYYSTQQGYDITGGNLTITPALLTYTANASSRVYGASNPIFTGTVTGLVNTDTLTNATTGTANFTTEALNTSTAGNYAISGSGLTSNNGNYTFTQAAANSTALSINPELSPDPVIFPIPPIEPPLAIIPIEPPIAIIPVLPPLAIIPVIPPIAVIPVLPPIAIIPVIPPSPTFPSKPPPSNPIISSVVSINNNVSSLITTVISANPLTITPLQAASDFSASPNNSPIATVHDVTNDFASSPTNLPNNILPAVFSGQEKEKVFIQPTLKIKNSVGRIKRLQMDSTNQYLSLLLEDGQVRVWDFQAGLQRQITTQKTNQDLTAISSVNAKTESLAIASSTGIGTYDIIGSVLDEKLSISKPDTHHFVASKDGNLLLVNAGLNELSLWDNRQAKKRWDLPYQRGEINALVMTDNQHYGAVLSRQPDAYVLPSNLQLQAVTDAIEIIDLAKGTVIQSLPNLGEHIVYMQFKNNDILQLGLASGEFLDWPIATNSLTPVANFAETVTAVDVAKDSYAYLLNDGTVRVGNGQGHILLSIKNEENPFKYAKLVEGDKKLLTVMANGELSVWDVASGVKMLRLFSTQQGWTAMDAFGRFDGSEEALENFTWAANEVDIPLDSFSENYYEPGLVANVLHNQDYLNSNPLIIKEGITLPPKVALQMAEQQTKSDQVSLQLDVYDRGGGINKIHVYQNGKLLNNENVIAAQQILPNNNAEHRVLTLNVAPSAGKNTLKVIASNDMGIENSATELSFDGTSKAATTAIRMLTIGIDKYSDSSLNLDYSVADANAIGQALIKSSKIASSKSLYNENATKQKILAELKDISHGDQQDTLIIYFAGHGMALGKEWYFLPYETKMEPTPEQIAVTGITATELSDIFKDTKMQHILVMIDSCYSGAATDSFNKLQIGQHYITRNLSRSLGITMITSASKDKEAYELSSLGHGLFSYLMTQDIQTKDANHSAHGVAENIVKTLPAFSKKMVGAIQEPVIYTKGNNFMLTDASKETHKDEPTSAVLSSPKKLAQ